MLKLIQSNVYCESLGSDVTDIFTLLIGQLANPRLHIQNTCDTSEFGLLKAAKICFYKIWTIDTVACIKKGEKSPLGSNLRKKSNSSY